MSKKHLRPAIQAIPDGRPFIPADHIERVQGRPLSIIVGANENRFGFSPKVSDAIAHSTHRSWRYPDGELHDLRAALGTHLGVGMEHITVGGGIDGILCDLVRLTLDPTDTVVTSLGAYPTFNYHVVTTGAQVITVPYKDDHEDLEALAAAAQKHHPKLLYLANPDNPMGTWHSAEAISAFAASLPEETLFILDEAYIECAPEDTAPPLVPRDENCLRLRTFSKIYGLAGLRVGYGIGPVGLISAFDKVRNHFGVADIAQRAALAALGDQRFVETTAQKIAHARTTITRLTQELGGDAIPSATNFVAVDFNIGLDGANALLARLTARDVFIRKPMVPVLGRTLRMSVAPDPELEQLFEIIKDELPRIRA